MVGNGIRPQVASAQAPEAIARRMWLTGDEDPCCTSPSADGRYIAYTDWSTGDVGIRDLVSGISRRLTNSAPGASEFAEPVKAISADGKMIAYLWVTQKGEGDGLRVISATGGTPRVVSKEYMLPYGWTPDNKQLLVERLLQDHTWQIALVSVNDGAVRGIKSLRWVHNTGAQLSPDGRFIAYARPVDDTSPARDIFLLAVDGSTETALVESHADDYSPKWSPDGAQIFFVSNRTGKASLWTAPVKDGKPKGSASLIQASFDNILGITSVGALYYTSRGNAGSNIYRADLNSAMKITEPAHVATERFLNANLGPQMSADGQRLAYFSRRSGPVIVVRTLKTGLEQDFTLPRGANNMNSNYGPMLFPGGDSVLLFASDPQRPGRTFYRVYLTDGRWEPIHQVPNLSSYALSPDGKTLYYDDVTDFVRFNIVTKQETVLKRGVSINSISISPDGEKVAYVVSGVGPKEDGSRVEIMPASGGEARIVYHDSPWVTSYNYNGIGWSADARSLLLVRSGPSGDDASVLWRVPIDGGPAEELGISRKGRIQSPFMLPDGQQIYFQASEPAPGELWALENFLPRSRGK